MRSTMLTLSLLACLGLAPQTLPAQTPTTVAMSAVAAADPSVQLQDLVRQFRSNDLAAIVRGSLPPAHYQTLLDKYEEARSKPISDKDRADFAEGLQKLITPDAVDQLMAEIEPKMRERAVQSEGMILMGLGAMNMAVTSPDSDLTEEQRAMLKRALPGIEAWVIETDFFSVDTLRQALTLVADAARRTGISDLDQIRMLSFEQLLAHGGRMLGAGKQAVKLYGIDLDAIVSTARMEVLEVEGDEARVRTTVTVFDAPLHFEQSLVLVEGRWYTKEAARDWKRHVHIEFDGEEPVEAEG
ncbi:hypothetical protein [uncultured Aquimonas sp.]|uniref:hypothetical protein n=1 Tax=uncultured Aquimonas sp. TaxID=385483 RepID=UPI00086AC5C3|nr:hypothetical protein [uncultured Aquimonas sp.]ODU47844.1 MAG: hypothetical protein ABS96_02720 [Xanthomonadaceae bacterium SCN 69-123]